MRIVTYDEIDPEHAMLIDQVCFGIPMTPNRVKLIRQTDRRCSDYYGVYALDDEGRAVSQVVVLQIETQTRDGREKVAGIAGVATLPTYSRRGLSTALMRRAHELTRERGIRISMLLTSASLVAYEMYEKLGYSTLVTLRRGNKRLLQRPKKNPRLRLGKFRGIDAEKLDELFAAEARGRLGFVHRQEKFMSMMVRTQQIPREQIKVAIGGGKAVGYIRTEKAADWVSIQELVGFDRLTCRAMLDEFEREPKAKWALCYAVSDPGTYAFYESQGYKIHDLGWGRVMATSLDSSLHANEIARLYGVDEGRFMIRSADMF